MKKILFLIILFASVNASAQIIISDGNQNYDSLSHSWKWEYNSINNYSPSKIHPTKILIETNGVVCTKRIMQLNKDSLVETETDYSRENKFSRWRKTETIHFTYQNGKFSSIVDVPIIIHSKYLETQEPNEHSQPINNQATTTNLFFYPDSSTKIEILYDSMYGQCVQNIKIITELKNGKVISEKTYYNKKSMQISSSVQSDSAGWVFESQKFFIYNESGQLIKTKRVNWTGEKYFMFYDYNKNGDLISSSEMSRNDSLSPPGLQYQNHYEYSPDRKTIFLDYYGEGTRRVIALDKPPLHYIPEMFEIFPQ